MNATATIAGILNPIYGAGPMVNSCSRELVYSVVYSPDTNFRDLYQHLAGWFGSGDVAVYAAAKIVDALDLPISYEGDEYFARPKDI